jgi:hypothetical protein
VSDPTALLALSGLIAAMLVFIAARRHAPTLLALVAALDTLCGSESVLLAGAHLTSIIGRALAGRGSGDAPFVYNFRFYSLVLTGFVIVVPGFLCLLSVRGLIRGEEAARRTALWASVALLAVNVPLTPIQGFAYALAAVALVNLAGLAFLRGRFRRAEKGKES